MIAAVSSICIALAHPADSYAGDPPPLREPKPALPAAATSAKGFAPPGWIVEQTAEGDLNHDGRPDLVAVLRGTDPACIVPTEGGSNPLDTNPRLLLVAFGGAAGFALQTVNAGVIPRVDDPYMDDPLAEKGVVIRGDVLRLSVAFWRSMGGWTTYNSTLSFRWDGKRFPLIGFDRETLRRNTGETETLSINFVAARARVLKGSMQDDVADSTRWQRLPTQKPESLETIGDALAYEPKLKSTD